MPKSVAKRHREAGDRINGLSATATIKLSRLRTKAVNRNELIRIEKFAVSTATTAGTFEMMLSSAPMF